MIKTSVVKTVVLSAMLLGLAACGGSDDDSSPEPAAPVTPTTPAIPTTPELPTTPDPGPQQPVGGNTDLSNDRPQFLTSVCGTLPISAAVQSNDASAPTVITPGQVVSGRIDPDSATNTEHFWSITLQAGYYHIVLDSDRVDSRSSNLGMALTDLNGFAADDDVSLLRGNEIGYRTRNHAFIQVVEARTLTLRARPRFSAEDYSFAIFENGSTVPSPYYTDCPTIMPLSLDTTEAFNMPRSNSADKIRWYQVDLEARDYVLRSSAARTDGKSSNIIYRYGYLDQFGQDGRYVRISRVNDIDTNTTGLGALNRTEPGPVWIRLNNSNDELTMEFTLSPDS